MTFVAGVEISITWAGKTVHIVGLGIDENYPDLREGLASVRGGRASRGREIAAQLEAAGIPGAFEGAMKFADNPDMLGRTHFARFLVEAGVRPTVGEVFQSFLVEGKPGFVPHRWATLEQSVRWIRAAGGRAVIAHPGRYPFTELQLDTLAEQFRQLGGEGVEVVEGAVGSEAAPRVLEHLQALDCQGQEGLGGRRIHQNMHVGAHGRPARFCARAVEHRGCHVYEGTDATFEPSPAEVRGG